MFCVLLTVCGWVSGWVVGWLLRSKLIKLVVISDSNSTHNTVTVLTLFKSSKTKGKTDR